MDKDWGQLGCKEQMMKDFNALRKVCASHEVEIVSPAETGCMVLGFKTDDLIAVLDRRMKSGASESGLGALKYLSRIILNSAGAGLMDYQGYKINVWVEANKEYFQDLTDDDYKRLCSDGYVYTNSVGKSDDEKKYDLLSNGIGNGGCGEDLDDKEDYPDTHNDLMDWFWKGWF